MATALLTVPAIAVHTAPVQRFAVERTSAGVDVRHLVDLTNPRLSYGRN